MFYPAEHVETIAILARRGFFRCRAPRLIACVVILAGAFHVARSAHAALSAEGDVLFAQVDANTYRYSLDLQNTGTTTIGTFWYAWIPGEDFMATSPLNIVSPAGWNATITGGGANNGFAIQWTTNAPIAAGTELSGFGFDSA